MIIRWCNRKIADVPSLTFAYVAIVKAHLKRFDWQQAKDDFSSRIDIVV